MPSIFQVNQTFIFSFIIIIDDLMDLLNDNEFMNTNQSQQVNRDQDYNHKINFISRRIFFVNSLKTSLKVNHCLRKCSNGEEQQSNQPSLECNHCPNIMQCDRVCKNVHGLIQKISQTSASNQSQEINGPILLKAIIRHHKNQIILITLYLLLEVLFRVSFVALLMKLFENVSQKQQGKLGQSYLMANMCGLALMASEVFRQNGLHQSVHFLAVVKNELLFLTYGKISKFFSYLAQQQQIGTIINIFEADFKGVEAKVSMVFSAISTPVPVVLFIYLLYQQIGYIAFIALFLIIFFFVFQVIVAKALVHVRSKLLIERDYRMKISSQVIENIKPIKLYGWQIAFQSFILALRDNQLTHLLKFYILKSIERVNLETSSFAIIIVTLFITDKSSYGQNLTTEKMFVSICIFFFLRNVSGQFGLGVSFHLEFQLILERLSKILNLKNISLVSIENQLEQPNKNYTLNNLTPNFSQLKHQISNEQQLEIGGILFENFSCYWKKDPEGKPSLQNVNINIKFGSFVGITGKVGSGKSTFLAAILGEIPFCSGKLIKKGSIAFVEQEPFIMSTSIEENVLFGRRFEEEKYKQVLRRTCMDIDIKLFEQGDQTIVGERGVTLSGGQKARISLARALYSDSDIYLLDDPLSAVDSHVARKIYEQVILHLRNRKTIILVTHQVSYLSECDIVMILKNGKVTHEDAPKNLIHVMQSLTKEQKSIESGLQNPYQQKDQQRKVIQDQFSRRNKITVKQPQMSFLQYFMYSRANYFLFMVTLASNLLTQVVLGLIFRVLAQYSITKKNKNSYFSSLNQFWAFLGIMCIIYVLISFIKSLGIYICTLNTNKKLYKEAIQRLIRAPCSYFDVTSLGDVVIRLSDNMNEIEDELTYFLIPTILNPFNILMILINVSLVSHLFFIPTVISLTVIIFWFSYLSNCLKQTKKLAINTKSLILAKVLETFHGLTQIRIYNKRMPMMNEFAKLLNDSLKANRCFADVFRVFVAYSCYIFNLVLWAGYLIGIFDLKDQEAWLYVFSAGLLFCLNDSFRFYSLNLVTVLGMKVNIYKVAYLTTLPSEKQFNSQYDKMFGLNNQPEDYSQKKKLNLWTENSTSIKVQNLSMRYQPDLPLVLHGISFEVKNMEKVGIVGRTGSGKSSIVQALLRLYEPEEGTVYEIGGFDALQLGLHTLRQNISVIPQMPFLFKATVRKNLDPFDIFSNEQIWTALQQSSLKGSIEKLPEKLDTVFENSAEVLSVGEKQLLCLARALLRKSDILILDEATSNVDMISDEFIQRCIKKYFSHSIVITIAHRLQTIADYDKIFVIEKGEIVERGIPHELILKNGAFAKMVQCSGSMAQQIKRIAKQSYFK